MEDRDFLIWLHARLEEVYGENVNVDYMLKLKSIIKGMSEEKITPNFVEGGSFKEERDMNRTLKTMTDGERKALPVFDGAMAYFPNALALIAENSLKGQAQHEPDMPLMWHRHKSRDELGSLARHLLDYAIAENEGDYEGMLSATKAMAWRACAHAERFVATTEEDPERYQKVEKLRS